MRSKVAKIFKKIFLASAAAIFVFCFSLIPALAAPGLNRTISYQGRLTDAAGVNVADGAYNLKLVIYDALSGGTCVWSAKDTDANVNTVDCGAPGALSVAVTGGLFSVTLGDTAGGQNALPAAVYTDNARWLGVTVNADAEMAPRRQLTAAYQALNSLTLNSLATSAVGGSSAFVPVTDASGNLLLTQNLTAGSLIATSSVDLTGASIVGANALVFDGATPNANKTTFAITDPTAPRTITFKNESGTVAYLSDLATAGVPTADVTQFTVQGFSTQTAPIVRFTNFSGGDLVSFSSTGSVTLAAGQSYTGTGAVNLSSGTGALTITGAGASTWSTTAGNLTLQAGSGIISLGTTTNLNAAGALTIASTGGANDLSLTSGSGLLHLGPGTNTIINTDLATNLVLDAEGDVKIGDGDTLILGLQATDPAGVNGAMYYETSTNKFRCFINGAWTDCVTGGTVTGTGSNGQVAFWNGASSQTGDSGLFWDNAAKHLGIGTSTTTANLSISADDAANNTFTDMEAHVHSTTGVAAAGIGVGEVYLAENTAGVPSLTGRMTSIFTDPTAGAQNSAFTFQTRTAGGPLTERLRIDDTGRLIPGATDNAQDIGSATNRWRTGYFGTSVVIGTTSYTGSAINDTAGSFSISATGGLSVSSSSGTVALGTGSNTLSNTDAGTDLIINAQRNVKIDDSSLLVISSQASDPAGPPATNGAIYYSTSLGEMRCFVSGAWSNCGTGAFTSAGGIAHLVASTDQVGIGTASPITGAKLQVVQNDATTNNITNALVLDHTTTGTAANGIGFGIDLRAENSLGTTTDAGHLNAFLTNATSGAEASAFSFETRTGGAGAAERLRITDLGILPALTNNSEDIGGAGNQWRSAYLGTSLILNANTTLADGSLATSSGNIGLQPAGSGTIANVQVGAGGAGSSTPDFLVVDSSSAGFGAGNPAGGVNGAMYYNAASGKFRCFEGGVWKDCDTSGATTLQTAYNLGATITTAGATNIVFTLTSGNFNATGAGAVNLTPTAASQFTSGGALTFTASAASTWSTTAGDLSLGSGSGILKLAASTNTLSNTDAATNLVLKATGSIKIDNTNTLVMASQASDPSGVDGATYYNTGTNKFRCFVNGSWSDCDTTGGTVNLQTAYNNGATIITGSGTPILFTLTAGDFNVGGAGNVSFTPSGTITLTAGAASTWGTSAGNLSLQAAGTGTTANIQIGAGGAGSATPDFLVMDIKSTATDPAGGTNGAMYYNNNAGKFRCFEGGGWKDCDTTGGTTTLQTAYNAGASITTSGSTPILFTLTSGNFNATGAGAVNLTPTAASQFTSGGALTFTAGAASTWSTTSGALTITSAAAATWGTSTGNLNVAAAGSGAGNIQIGSGIASATPDLLVIDLKSTAGDPSGTNGAMYYNTATDKFRCFKAGGWQDCLGTFTDASGINEMKIPTEQLQIGATPPPAGSKMGVSLDDAVNNGSSDVLVLDHTTSGTAANGIGSDILFRNENDAGTITDSADIAALLTNVANGTEDSSLRFSTRSGGAALAERMRITATGNLQPGITNNALDFGATLNRWRTGYFGTSVIIGNTTLSDGSLSSGGVLTLSSGGGSALSLSSSTGTVILAAGTNNILNSDANTDINLQATRNIKISDSSLLVLPSKAADPAGPPSVNGATYYNTVSDKFRCYVSGAWSDCHTTGAVTGTGTAGQVSFFTGATTLAGDNELFWDNTAKQLGIGTNTTHVGTKLYVEQSDANNTGVADVAAYEHVTSGTPTAGIGVGLLLRTQNSSGAEVSAARIAGILTDVTPASEQGAIIFETLNAGSPAERARIDNVGNLTFAQATAISSGSTGTLTLKTSNQTAGSTNSANVTLTSGNGAGATSNSGNIIIDPGTATGTAGTINIGNTNASAISIGRAGITNTNNGALTVAQLLTGQLGLTVSGATVSLNNNSNFNTLINTGTSTGAITIGNAAAGAIGVTSGGAVTVTAGAASTWSTTAGNLTLQAGSGTVSLGTSTLLTATGSLGITSAGAATWQTSSGALTITSAAGATWSTTAGALTLTSAAAATWSTAAGALTVDSAAALNLGTGNATSVSIGKTGATTTVNGALSVSQLLTASNAFTVATGNITVSGGNIVGASPLSFDGATADAVKTVFAITDPTITSKTITFPNATITVNAAADISGTTLASNVVTSSLTTVGALAAGSIVSGFGSIATANSITTSNNISTTGTGTITSAGLLTGSAGLTVTGGVVSLNASSNFNTLINTGTSTGTVSIGNSASTALNFTSGTGSQTHTSSNATGVTTASSFVFNDAALTSGTLAYLTSTSTSGKLLDLNFTNTTGTILNGAYGAATNQGAGALVGLSWDLNSNLTAPAAGQNVTGIDLKMPAASTTSGAAVYNGYNLATAGAITNATAGSFLWHGVNVVLPNITQSAGGSVTASGLMVNTGTITTAGTANGVEIAAAGIGAGSLNGVGISNITGGAGTEYALNIGTGWDAGIDFNDTTSVIRLGATDNTGVLKIVDSAATPNSLFEVRDLSTNFGGASTSGAFISRNSYFGEEFNSFHANTTATTAVIRGDSGVSGELSFSGVTVGAGGSVTAASQNATNGIERLTPVSGNAAARTAATLEYLGTTVAGTANNIYLAANLPVVTVKVMPSVVGANNRVFVGISDAAAAVTTMPVNGIFFSNCTASATCGTNWNGVVNVAGTVTTVSCGAVDTTHFAYGRIEVRSTTDVHFFMDTNTSDGIVETECGAGLTTTPSVAMTATIEAASVSPGAATNTTNFDVDYFRSWQDDNAPVATAMAAALAPADETPAPTVDQIQAETPADPVAAIAAKLSAGWQSVTDFVGARVTAIRGYFDEVFANKTHQKTLCVGDAASGNETCINKDQLDQLLSNQNRTDQQTLNAPSAPPAFVPPPTTQDTNANVPAQPAPETPTEPAPTEPPTTPSAPETTQPADTTTAPDTTPIPSPAETTAPSAPATVDQPPVETPAPAPVVETPPAPPVTEAPPAETTTP